MKPSLEDERRALLEQIEASRAVYRRMLSDEASQRGARSLSQRDATATQGSAGERAMQWMMDHPLWVAGGVALLVLVAPRVFGTSRRAARHKAAHRQREPEPSHGGTMRALLTAAALMLRDPARLRAAARIAQTAWHWMQRRRAAAPPPMPPSTRTTRLH